MTLRDELWAGAAPLYDKILDHPFVRGLTDGTLPREIFHQFVVQDAHYLRGYARALAICAAKAPNASDTVMFNEHAAGAIQAEQEMHAEFMGELGSSPEEAAKAEQLPTTLAYTSYLLAQTYGGSFAEGVGTVLPCYWIYARVGAHLAQRSSPDPLYARWIAAYGGEEFQQVVAAVLAVTDRIGDEISATERARMYDRFVTTSRYEWMFWDAAWRREAWPV